MSNKITVKENKHIDFLTNEFPNDPSEFFSLKNFKDNLQIEIKSLSDEEMIFDIKGVDAPLANALRRILISEIPTMAIDICNFYQNTSIIPDEVLAHRLGLVPIFADANLFNYKQNEEETSEFNSILFKLHAICPKNIDTLDVLSGDLKWIPQGGQKNRFEDIRPIHSDIVLTKLKPGQEIEIEIVCLKGIGKTHAKWSPVSTAYYRLLPEINLLKEVKGEKAIQIKQICPMKVFDIEDTGKLKIADSRKCTMCRECIRQEEYSSYIQLSKRKDIYECKNLYII